jgi:hypothetical protein
MISADLMAPIDIDLLLADGLSPEAQSAAIADFAQSVLDEAIAIDTEALGEAPEHQTIVDGVLGAALDSVRPDGTIVFQFDLAGEVVAWIEQQLIVHSPVGSGKFDPHPGLYQRSHAVYADGAKVDAASIPPGTKEIVLAPTVPYARLIEPDGPRPGESRQAPDGVYQAIAELARRRFAGTEISFQYRTVPDMVALPPSGRRHKESPRDLPQPAIVIEL